MLKEEALGQKKGAVRRKAVAMLQQAQASLQSPHPTLSVY